MEARPGSVFLLATLATLASLASGVAGALATGAAAGDPLVSKSQLQKLEAIAKDVASKGRDAEMEDLLDVVRVLGEDPTALVKARADCSKAIAGVKVAATGAPIAGIGRGLHSLASDLAKLLGPLDDTKRGTLAEQILRLDDDQPTAHKMLGHVLENGQWQSEEWKKLCARRRDIQAALLRSRRLEIALECKPAQFAPLAAFDKAPQTSVRFGKVEVISTLEAPRLERMVRSTLQAAALSNFLRGGALEVPPALKSWNETIVVVCERQKYLDALDRAVEAKGVEAGELARLRDLSGYYDTRRFYLTQSVSEVQCCADLLLEFSLAWLPETLQVCLTGGHVNWLALACFGTTIPGIVEDQKAGAAHEAVTSDRPRDTPEEKRAKSLESAGISGARRYLVFKAMHREDPAWSHSFVDDISKLVDLDLLKSTFVVEYLQEVEQFDALLRRSAMKPKEKKSYAEVIEAQIFEGLPAFEERFHAWLLPRGAAVVQRLERAAQPPDKPSREEAAAVADLERIRRQAWNEKSFGPYVPVELDRELSSACAKHVDYLKLHRAQLEKWPDAHEEYPDQEGFSSDGCWAGTHSVIAPGVSTAEAANHGWMGTFYHRLPLLDPGLKRIGFSLVDQIAVLDAGSLVEAGHSKGLILWPPHDTKGVPTSFELELPNPVPGLDEKQFGYPVTLQVFGLEVTYKMKLVRGQKADGPEVACHFSSPGHPTNLDCNPAGAYCLIPKSPLEGHTKYTVVAEASDGTSVVWSFTTD